MSALTHRQPAEWAPHEAVFVGWPSDEALWGADLAPAQANVAAFVRAIEGERVALVARGEDAERTAGLALNGVVKAGKVFLHQAPMGDVWLRDTGPVFTAREGGIAATGFAFNGWGGKYNLPHDEEMAESLAEIAGAPLRRFDKVLEGGTLDVDGAGTVLTTRQSLLNPNRNPGATEADMQALLRNAIGAEKVIWLDKGLANDHTDGHVDNIARFVAPGKVVCMHPTGDNDPNKAVYADIARTLKTATDAGGRRLEVIEIPSPGRVLDEEGAVMPASHLNFYISNGSLIMPTYDTPSAEEAVALLAALNIRENTVGCDARALLTGGGAFHCITQQVPKALL